MALADRILSGMTTLGENLSSAILGSLTPGSSFTSLSRQFCCVEAAPDKLFNKECFFLISDIAYPCG